MRLLLLYCLLVGLFACRNRGIQEAGQQLNASVLSALPGQVNWNTNLLLAYLSKLAYEPKEIFKEATNKLSLNYWGEVQFESDRGYIVGGDDFLIVAFRGTALNVNDIMIDSRSFYGKYQNGFAHNGFIAEYAKLKDFLFQSIGEIGKRFPQPPKLWFTGHSLGGALAHLAAYDFIEKKANVAGLVSFGSPRVFGRGGDYFKIVIPHHQRFVFGNDIITNLPGPIFYAHSGQIIYFTSECDVKGEEDGWMPFMSRAAKQMPVSQLVNFKGVKDHRIINYIQCLERLDK